MTVSSKSITVTAAPGAEPSTAERWLRLTIDPPERDEGVSKAQLAGMLDSLIGITDHCKQDSVPTENIDSKIKQKLSGQASCQSSAEQLQLAEKCSPARRTGLSLKKNVYAHWSDDQLAEDYRVVPLGSAIVLSGPVRGSKVINLVIDVTNSNPAPVRYHADEEARIALWRVQPPRWIGNVVVGKRIVAGPEIGWSNGKVLLGATVSGRLELWLPIIYDTWTISIPGVYIGDGKRSYKAKVLGVSELLAQPAEVNLEDETEGDPDSEDCSACGGSADAVPDDQVPSDGSGGVVVNGNPVYCYITINWTLYKSCTGAKVDSGTEYRGVECPKGEDITPTYNIGFNSIKELPDYIYEVGWEEQERYTGTDEVVIVAAEYKSKCCYDAVHPSCIPQCMTKKSTWYGTTWPLVEKKLKDEYGGETKIVYVGPRSGVCGTRKDEFSYKKCDICQLVILYEYNCGWLLEVDFVNWHRAGTRASDGLSFATRQTRLYYKNFCVFSGYATEDYSNGAVKTYYVEIFYDKKKKKFVPLAYGNWVGSQPSFSSDDKGFKIVSPAPPDSEGFVFSKLGCDVNIVNPKDKIELSRTVTISKSEYNDKGWQYFENCEFVEYTDYMSCYSAESYNPDLPPCP